MDDLVHSAAKEVEQNRWTYLLVVVAAAAPLLLAGCRWLDGTAPSPLTGEAMTGDALQAEGIKTIAELDALYEQQLAVANGTLARRNTLATGYNEAMRSADEQTDENVAIARTVTDTALQNPWVAAGLASIGMTSVAANVGQFFDRRRKDRVILQQKVKAAA